jgi:hypothetical protein
MLAARAVAIRKADSSQTHLPFQGNRESLEKLKQRVASWITQEATRCS